MNKHLGRPRVFLHRFKWYRYNNYRTLTHHVSIWPNVFEVKQHEQTTLFLYVSKSCCSCYDIKRLCIYIYIYTTFIYVIFCCPHQNLATKKNGWVDSTAAARNMFWYKFLPEHFPSTCFSLHPAYITPNQRFPIEKKISLNLKSIKIIFWNPLLYFSLGLNSQSWISRAVTRVGAGHLENPRLRSRRELMEHEEDSELYNYIIP